MLCLCVCVCVCARACMPHVTTYMYGYPHSYTLPLLPTFQAMLFTVFHVVLNSCDEGRGWWIIYIFAKVKKKKKGPDSLCLFQSSLLVRAGAWMPRSCFQILCIQQPACLVGATGSSCPERLLKNEVVASVNWPLWEFLLGETCWEGYPVVVGFWVFCSLYISCWFLGWRHPPGHSLVLKCGPCYKYYYADDSMTGAVFSPFVFTIVPGSLWLLEWLCRLLALSTGEFTINKGD